MRSSIELNDVKREAHNALFDLFHVECRDIIGTIHTGIETAQQGLAGVKYLLNRQILPVSPFPLFVADQSIGNRLQTTVIYRVCTS